MLLSVAAVDVTNTTTPSRVDLGVTTTITALHKQVGYVPLSFDRDHEVELAQLGATEEGGQDVRLHVQVGVLCVCAVVQDVSRMCALGLLHVCWLFAGRHM